MLVSINTPRVSCIRSAFLKPFNQQVKIKMAVDMRSVTSLLCCLLIIPASLQSESCSEPGIFATGKGRGFATCSENSDGTLTMKHGECNQGTVFSATQKMCMPMKFRKTLRTGVPGCYTKGYSCADCKTLNYCWDRGNGLDIVATKTCADDEYCSAYNNTCVKPVIAQCTADYTYTCNYMGLFPDPYKCNTYYFCENAASDPVTMTCPDGQYYDPLFMECIAYDRNTKAPCPPMEQCSADNTMKALARNPNIYYLCIQTGPNEYSTRVFRCPRNQIFNGDTCSSNATSTSGVLTTPFSVPS